MTDRFLTVAGVAALFALSTPAAEAQDWRTTTIMRQATNEELLNVDVGYGAGELTIQPADGDRMLYQASVRYDANHFEPIAEYDDGRLRLGLENLDHWSIDHDDDDHGRMMVRLGRGVPLDVDLDFGAAMADIELGGLSVRSLDVATGASETRIRFSEPNAIAMREVTFDVGAASFRAAGLGNANARTVRLNGGVAEMELDFSGEWRGDTRLEIDFGLGSVKVRVPRDVGVRLHKETLLASLTAPRMSQRGGDEYYSDNWDSASHRLTIDVEGAFGDITIDWID